METGGKNGAIRRAGGTARGPRALGRIVIASCAMLMITSGAVAQQTYRDLTGTVEDDHHEPLRGAIVYLEDQNTHGVTTYLTDRSGRFSFKRLHGEWDYQVWAMYRGDRSKTKTVSQFDTKTAVVVVLEIKPKSEDE